jgi:hypothetical protein
MKMTEIELSATITALSFILAVLLHSAIRNEEGGVKV